LGTQPAKEATAMQQFFDALLRFLQQGISAIFRFVELIWGWSVTQISSLMRVPWQDWPLWKQIFLAAVIVGVIYALYKVAMELWEAGERILAAFATLLGVLVRTLPSVMIAGLVALGGLWVLNNVDFSKVRLPAFLQTTSLDGK
jgi:hydrogenase/urease accessory protein HupE